jgi:large subunit ribosomal protein L25
MKADLSMQLEPRGLGHKGLSYLRKSGKVPGVLYGGTSAPVNFEVPLGSLLHTLNLGGEHHPFSVRLEGSEQLALIKEVQRDRYTGVPTHLDLLRVEVNAPITVELPIRVAGEHELLARGLFLSMQMHAVTVRGKADALPEAIEVQVGELAAGHTATLADLQVPAGVDLLDHPTQVLFSIAHGRVQPEETPEVRAKPGLAHVAGPGAMDAFAVKSGHPEEPKA